MALLKVLEGLGGVWTLSESLRSSDIFSLLVHLGAPTRPGVT